MQPNRARAALLPERAQRAPTPGGAALSTTPSSSAYSQSPSPPSAAFTRALSSKHCTVRTAPKKRRAPPKLLKTGGTTRKLPLESVLCSSHRSQVANGLFMVSCSGRKKEICSWGRHVNRATCGKARTLLLFSRGKAREISDKKNNTQERKTSVFAWKADFSPVASAVPEEKQFFTGD